jgi:hypothetical protein
MPNSREQALLIWLAIGLLWCVAIPTIRNGLIGVIRAAMVRPIVLSVVLMFAYIGSMIVVLDFVGLWTFSNATTTCFWTASVAFVALFRINSMVGTAHYFRNAVINQLKLLAIFEFIINLYAFNIWAELVIIPVTAFLAALLAVSESKPEFKSAKTLLEWVFALFVFVLAISVVLKITNQFQIFASVGTLRDFALPPLMTLVFLPFLFALGLFVSYENLFIRLHFFVEGAELVRFAKIRILLTFHVRRTLLNEWSKHINKLHFRSRDDVESAIRSFVAMHRVEKS